MPSGDDGSIAMTQLNDTSIRKDTDTMENADTKNRLTSLFRRPAPAQIDAGAVLFDVCGVLYDDSPWKRWLLQLITRLGVHTQYTSFFRVWEREYLVAVRRGELDFWEALRRFLQATGLTSAQTDEVEAAAHARHRYFEGRVHPMPGTGAMLSRLRACGVPLGVLSFSIWDPDELRTKLVQLKLDRYFPVADVWCRESDCAPVDRFRQAADDLGVPTKQVIFVGRDSLQLKRAHAAGLATAAINQDGDATADVYLERIDQLSEMLSFSAATILAG